jgi:predicted TIM-barrel fold metal-dependent hydrolase
MMWASNFPHIVHQAGYGTALTLVDAALPDIPARDRAAIMGGTAVTLWNLGG